jgi:predicted MFS family arabinose efflux permease
MSRPVLALTAAPIAANAADQLVLAALPLILVAAGTPAPLVAVAVAMQSAAWLLVSLPLGVLADRLSRRRLMIAGAGLVVAGGALGFVLLQAGVQLPGALGTIGFLLAAGAVTIVLTVFAAMPRHVPVAALPTANARIELGRAVGLMLAPLVAAHFLGMGTPELVFALAGGIGLVALVAARAVPADDSQPPSGRSLLGAIAEGCHFVAREPILRAIALCAIAWNAAYFALLSCFVPFVVDVLAGDAAQAARALSANGAGLLLGAIVAPTLIARAPTGALFVFGPASALVGAALIAVGGSGEALGSAGLGFFLIGFGPMIWAVLQTSVRQTLTPPSHLARVAATLTSAIYGVRPLGALAAAGVSAAGGPAAGMGLAVALFALSLLAILVSPVRGLATISAASEPAQ